MKSALLLGCIVVLLCGGLFLVLDVSPDGPREDDVPAEAPAEPAPPPPRELNLAPAPAPATPSETETRIAALIEGLASSRLSYREKSIVGLGKLGAAATAALPHLAKLIETQGGRIRYAAMVAVMQIEGSRRYYAEMAEAAAVYKRGRNDALVALRRHDPARAEAVIAAIRIRGGKWKNLVTPQGLEPFLARLCESDAGGIAELNDRIRSATAAELPSWLAILSAMRPMPAEVAPALRDALREGDAKERQHVIYLLTGAKNDTRELREPMAPFIRDLAQNADPEYRGRLLSSLGALGSVEPETMQVLLAGLKEGGSVADGAASSLARFGTEAKPAIEELIRVAESRAPGERYHLLRAILASKDRRAIPLLREALQHGHYRELKPILDKVHEVDGAADLAPDFLVLFEKVAVRDLSKLMYAAVRCDRGLTRPETVTLLTRAFGEARPGSRRNACYLITSLSTLPPAISEALASALGHAREENFVSAAQRAIRDAARFGEQAAAIHPVIVPLAADARFESCVAQALLGIRPQAPESIAVFRRLAVEGRSRTTKARGVTGLGQIEKPTAADKAALQAVLDGKTRRYSSVLRAAAEILKRPEWKAL